VCVAACKFIRADWFNHLVKRLYNVKILLSRNPPHVKPTTLIFQVCWRKLTRRCWL
jgi:hypothetical protein